MELVVESISAQNLKRVKPFLPAKYYVEASVDEKQKKTTSVDKDGGSNPVWNQKDDTLTFEVDDRCLPNACDGGTCSYMTMKILRKRYRFFKNDQIVGTVIIRLDRKLLDNVNREKGAKPNFMTFEVIEPSRKGKGKGVLHLTIKFREKRTAIAAPPMEDPQTNPPKASSYGAAAATTGSESMTIPPKVSSYGPSAGTISSVCPPPKASNFGAGAEAIAGSSYIPASMATCSSTSSNVENPRMAGPTSACPLQQHDQNYDNQQDYNSKPPKRHHGGRTGVGALAGAIVTRFLGFMICNTIISDDPLLGGF